MRGTILGVDRRSGTGVLRAEDRRRYRFALSQWRDARPPAKGDRVDFEPVGDSASEIYRIASWRSRLSPRAVRAGFVGLLHWFRDRPEAIIALALMAACALPVYAFLSFEASIFAVPRVVERLELGLGRIRSMVLDIPEASTAAAALRAIMPVVYVLWIIPILSLVLFYRALAGRPRHTLAIVVGLLAVVLPVAVPFAIAIPTTVMVLSHLPPDVRATVSAGVFDAASPDLIREIAYGSYVMMLLGFALVLWGFKPPKRVRRRVRPARAQLREPAPATPVAPRLRARQPAAGERPATGAHGRLPAPHVDAAARLPDTAGDTADPLPRVLTRRKRRPAADAVPAAKAGPPPAAETEVPLSMAAPAAEEPPPPVPQLPPPGMSAQPSASASSGLPADVIATGWEVRADGRSDMPAPEPLPHDDWSEASDDAPLPGDLRGGSHEPDIPPAPAPPGRFDHLPGRLRDLIEHPPARPLPDPPPAPEPAPDSVNGTPWPQAVQPDPAAAPSDAAATPAPPPPPPPRDPSAELDKGPDAVLKLYEKLRRERLARGRSGEQG